MAIFVALLAFAVSLMSSDGFTQERIRIAWAGATPTNGRSGSSKSGGVKTLLDDLAPKNPKLAGVDPRSFIDTSLVQEVEASGFVKQLYGR